MLRMGSKILNAGLNHANTAIVYTSRNLLTQGARPPWNCQPKEAGIYNSGLKIRFRQPCHSPFSKMGHNSID
jgi:hypothetical protein